MAKPARPPDRKAQAASSPAVTKVADVASLVERGRRDPGSVERELHTLASSADWQVREVAATTMVEIGKKHPEGVLGFAHKWARSPNENVRRAASEGLRGIARHHPDKVREILETLREDRALYVKKSVANVLRNMSRHHPDFVLEICREWARSTNPHTRWIVKDGLRKLIAVGSPKAQELAEQL